MRYRKGVDLDWTEGGKEWKTIIRVYYMRKKRFSIKGKNLAVNYFLCIQDPVTRTVYSLVAERRELSVCTTPLRREEYICR